MSEVMMVTSATNPVGSSVQTVKIWLKAFIPGDLDSSEIVQGGSHAGKTALSAPGPIQAWFLTDQRQFSSDINSSARYMSLTSALSCHTFVYIKIN